MRIAPTFKHFYSGHRVIFLVILCLFGLSAVFSQRKQGKKRQQPQTEDNRVYLVHADRLHYDQYVNPEAQILNGSVAFRHQGLRFIATVPISMRCPTRLRPSEM